MPKTSTEDFIISQLFIAKKDVALCLPKIFFLIHYRVNSYRTLKIIKAASFQLLEVKNNIWFVVFFSINSISQTFPD